MFVLRTGLQGNGKTLNTIKEVDLKAANEGRAVYYHNIRGFNPNAEVLKGVWIPFDDPHEWHKLPENSIIVIDEAQTFFRVRKQAAAVPEYASALETMRHRGHELHCITQSPGLIDHHFRKLCNSHIHYVRGHKGKVIKRWEFERVNPDVERKNTFQEGEASRVLIDKKYFGVYQSVAGGSEHHMRFKPPRALFILGGCLLLMSVLGYTVYQNRLSPPVAVKAAGVEGMQPANTTDYASQTPRHSRRTEPLTVEEYLALHTPRLADVPSSAPLYDQVTQAVTYPKLSCIATHDTQAIIKYPKAFTVGERGGKIYGCRCNTQQGTRAMISAAACLNYVENGSFDPAKADYVQAVVNGQYLDAPVQGRGAGAASAAPRHSNGASTIPVGSFGALTSDPLVP